MTAETLAQPTPPRRSLPRRVAFSLLRIAAVSYAGLFLFLLFFQSLFLYRPTRELNETPRNLGLAYEDVWFDSPGARLNGWYVPAKPGSPTVLFCHSNYANLSQYVSTIWIMNGLGFNVFIFDYRGYGRSTGEPSEAGTYDDASAALAWLLKSHPPAALIIWGRSLGGAHAARLAVEHPPRALVIESAFSSFPAVAHDFFPYIPVSLIARYSYPTADDAARVKCPTLVIHSPDDEVVDFRHGRIIYDRLNSPKQFLQISGNHNDGFLATGLSYEQGLKKFFRDNGLMEER